MENKLIDQKVSLITVIFAIGADHICFHSRQLVLLENFSYSNS